MVSLDRLLRLLYGSPRRFTTCQVIVRVWSRPDLVEQALLRSAARQEPGSTAILRPATRGSAPVVHEYFVHAWVKQPASWRYEVGRTSATPARAVAVHGRVWLVYNRHLPCREPVPGRQVPLRCRGTRSLSAIPVCFPRRAVLLSPWPPVAEPGSSCSCARSRSGSRVDVQRRSSRRLQRPRSTLPLARWGWRARLFGPPNPCPWFSCHVTERRAGRQMLC